MTKQERWNRKNRHVLNESQAWYRAKRHNAIPPWAHAERPAMRELYKAALHSGQEVDHIVPLDDPDVCGLHCMDNLRLLPPEENKARATMYWAELNADVPF